MEGKEGGREGVDRWLETKRIKQIEGYMYGLQTNCIIFEEVVYI